MEIEDSAKSGVDPETLEEAAEVLAVNGQYRKLTKAGIDRLFVKPVDRQEMQVILSHKLRQPFLSPRYFIPLCSYYMQLRHWTDSGSRHRRERKKNVAPLESDAEIAELHTLVTEIEKQKGTN